MDENTVLVRCRLCGKKWRLPKYVAERLYVDRDRGVECVKCRPSLKYLPFRVELNDKINSLQDKESQN